MLRIKKLIMKKLPNRGLITDLLSILVITFGIVLICNGVILITTNASNGSQGVSSQFAMSATNSIPGIPISITDLSQTSVAGIGLVSWIIGLNLLFIGLGLWIKHKLARVVGIVVFGLACFFQFIQFLLVGIVGSPISVIQMFVNGALGYLLFAKFDYSSNLPIDNKVT